MRFRLGFRVRRTNPNPYLTLTPPSPSPSANLTLRQGLAAPAEALRAALLPHATPLAPLHAADPAAVGELRGAVKRQTYAYALPYAYLPASRAAHTRCEEDGRPVAPVASSAAPAPAVAVAEAEAGAEAEADVEAGVWLSNAPHGCWTSPTSLRRVRAGRGRCAGAARRLGFAPRNPARARVRRLRRGDAGGRGRRTPACARCTARRGYPYPNLTLTLTLTLNPNPNPNPNPSPSPSPSPKPGLARAWRGRELVAVWLPGAPHATPYPDRSLTLLLTLAPP